MKNLMNDIPPPPSRKFKETFWGRLVETKSSKEATKLWNEKICMLTERRMKKICI